ncbi:MAG: hypothetical protein LC794_10475 [Acidobacteria bacterium]|nr:hypothetical protein [Acidobacteriota bacterium]MCA1627090.1 hypothetical protein [Acidobacteriota bacterium]
MKISLLALLVLLVLLVVFSLLSTKERSVANKTETSAVRYKIKDLRKHGVSLIAPSDAAGLGKTVTIDPYSVVMKNTNGRSIVGYSIKWECFGGERESPNRDTSYDYRLSNILGLVFMYGDESERSTVLSRLDGVIAPNSTWLLSPNFPARRLHEGGDEIPPGPTATVFAEVLAACPVMTIIADGIFFDDGTFVGPDTRDFFAKVKTQVEVRHEVLERFQSELTSGKTPTDVFRGLEQAHAREFEPAGEREMSADETRAYFTNLFARDLLGTKTVLGEHKTIENVQRQLSRPWVTLRRLATED